MMGEGNFTWLGGLAPANQRRLGGGVVWVAEGTTLQKFSVAEQTGERMNHRHFERFGGAARRQNTWEPRGSILLPEPGGPIINRLWPPAATTSSARLALSCL